MKEINNSLTNSLRLGPWRSARETPRIAGMKARRELPGRLCEGPRGRRIVVTFDEVGQTGRLGAERDGGNKTERGGANRQRREETRG